MAASLVTSVGALPEKNGLPCVKAFCHRSSAHLKANFVRGAGEEMKAPSRFDLGGVVRGLGHTRLIEKLVERIHP